jgi:hypothetical protein
MLDQAQFQELVRRVAALEARVPTAADVPTAANDRRFSKRALANRWNVSPRTVDRIREDPAFPEPDIVNSRPYWWASQIIQYERSRATKTKVSPPREFAHPREGPLRNIGRPQRKRRSRRV